MKQIGHAESVLSSIREPLGSLSPVTAGAYVSRALVVAAFLVAYVIFEWVSFIHEYNGLPITPWNPGLGVVFALMIFGGARYGVVLFAGVVVAEIVLLQSSLKWPIILGISAIIAAGYGTVAAVARKNLRLEVGLLHLRDVLILLAAGISGAALVALLLSLFLLANAQLDLVDILVASGLLFIGDAIGIAVMTPLTLRLALRGQVPSIRSLRALVSEVALYVAVVSLSLWVIFGTENVDGFKFFYVLFLPVVVAAMRYGLDGACIGLFLTQLALVGLLHRYGYDARAFAEFQMLMLVLTTTGLIVGVVVTERQNADRAVRESEARFKEKEAEVAHAARFSLVSGMASALAHEINQPMAAARALARSAQELLRIPQADLSRADKNLTTLIAEIDLASGIVRRMREFLRRGRPHVSTINVQSMLDDILTLIRPEATSRQIAIDVDAPNDLPPVYGDRVQLQQVVLNLIRNAIDSIAGSSRSDGRIRITARRSDDSAYLEISVSDNGPGIPADLADRLFQPLTTSKKEGLGLGLSICLAIVEAHGSRIWLHANRAGATEFRFSLPLEPPKQT